MNLQIQSRARTQQKAVLLVFNPLTVSHSLAGTEELWKNLCYNAFIHVVTWQRKKRKKEQEQTKDKGYVSYVCSATGVSQTRLYILK